MGTLPTSSASNLTPCVSSPPRRSGSGCSCWPRPAEEGVARTTFELSQGDSGTTLQVAPDDEIVISLESNPTTGYGWHEAEKSQNNGILQLLAKSYESESDAIGSGGVETWTYKASRPARPCSS